MESISRKLALSEVIADQPDGISNAVILEIISALKSVRYGSLEVVIHNSKIVQIEKKEKFRIGQEKPKAGR
jgi:hypothetical protein